MQLSEALYLELQKPLPGSKYQNELLPSNRSNTPLTPKEVLTEAAVAVIIGLGECPLVFLMKRAQYDGHHSGQISFPGGKRDPHDANLVQTAIRETFEEIGIQLEPNRFLGALTPLPIAVSGFMVSPFVFWHPEPFHFVPDRNEVQYVVQSRLTDILAASTIKHTRISVRGYTIDAPYFDLENETVWGATSMILSEFREILRRIEKNFPGIIGKTGC